jgi:hypothetical protein
MRMHAVDRESRALCVNDRNANAPRKQDRVVVGPGICCRVLVAHGTIDPRASDAVISERTFCELRRERSQLDSPRACREFHGTGERGYYACRSAQRRASRAARTINPAAACSARVAAPLFQISELSSPFAGWRSRSQSCPT